MAFNTLSSVAYQAHSYLLIWNFMWSANEQCDTVIQRSGHDLSSCKFSFSLTSESIFLFIFSERGSKQLTLVILKVPQKTVSTKLVEFILNKSRA